MDIRGELTRQLERDRDKLIGLCQDLVRIPSENPPGDTTAIVDFVVKYLEQHGVDYEVVAPESTMPNVVASFNGGETGQHLVLNGHLDTFPAGDPARWSLDPFSGEISDGKLHGRGAADMKTGTAASILTYIYLSRVQQHLKGKLTLQAVSDEETFGPWGSRYLVENRPELIGDAVLNGEPSGPGTIRFGEKGMIWLELNVTSKGGYGSYAGITPNAIDVTVDILTELRSLSELQPDMPGEIEEQIEAAREVLDKDLGPNVSQNLSRVTVNAGVTSGGPKLNLISADCRTEIDIRIPIGLSTETVLREIDQIVTRQPGASYQVLNRAEPNYCNIDHPLFRMIQENAEQVRGIRPIPSITMGGTDTRLWRLRGKPGFFYGPAPINLGAPDEYVTLDDLLGTIWVHVLTAYDYLSQ